MQPVRKKKEACRAENQAGKVQTQETAELGCSFMFNFECPELVPGKTVHYAGTIAENIGQGGVKRPGTELLHKIFQLPAGFTENIVKNT